MQSIHAPQRREPSRLYASDADFAAARARLAARMGRRFPQTPEEEDAAERVAQAAIDAMQGRCERRQRALDAYRAKARTKRPRMDRPPPRESRQYTPAMATTAGRDERLVMGARVCLQLIRALIGRAVSRVITKAALARALGCHVRTVQRYLSQARALGYIIATPVFAANGRQIGQRISLTDKLRPYWEQVKSWIGVGSSAPDSAQAGTPTEASGKVGETEVSPTKALRESETDQHHACRKGTAASTRSSKSEHPPDR